MAAKSKLRKELKGPDDFMTIANKGLTWMVERRRQIVIAIAAVSVVAAGIWTWRYFAGRSARHASAAFSEAMTTYRRPLKGDYGADPTSTDPEKKPFENAKARAKAALPLFRKVIDKHAGTPVARMSQLFAGNCLVALGDVDKAIPEYEAFLKSGPSGHLQALALENLGYAYERKKQYEQALDAFGRMSKGGAYPERGLYHVGRIHKLRGSDAKAKEFYEKALKKAKEAKVDWFAREMESKIALLELER